MVFTNVPNYELYFFYWCPLTFSIFTYYISRNVTLKFISMENNELTVLETKEEMPEILKLAIAAAYVILPVEDKLSYTRTIMGRCDYVCTMRDRLEEAKEKAEEMNKFISYCKQHMKFESQEESAAFDARAQVIIDAYEYKIKHFEKGVEEAIRIADSETEREYRKKIKGLKSLGFPVDIVRLAYGLSSKQVKDL